MDLKQIFELADKTRKIHVSIEDLEKYMNRHYQKPCSNLLKDKRVFHQIKLR